MKKTAAANKSEIKPGAAEMEFDGVEGEYMLAFPKAGENPKQTLPILPDYSFTLLIEDIEKNIDFSLSSAL